MFDEIKYVYPEKSKCQECGCSFGVHLRKCSKLVSPNAGRVCGGCECVIDSDGTCGCNPVGS